MKPPMAKEGENYEQRCARERAEDQERIAAMSYEALIVEAIDAVWARCNEFCSGGCACSYLAKRLNEDVRPRFKEWGHHQKPVCPHPGCTRHEGHDGRHLVYVDEVTQTSQ